MQFNVRTKSSEKQGSPLLIGLLFILVGGGIMTYAFYTYREAAVAQKSAVVAPAVVKEAWLERSNGRRSSSSVSGHLIATVERDGVKTTRDVRVANRSDVYDLDQGDAIQISIVPGDDEYWLATTDADWSRFKNKNILLIPFGFVFASAGALVLRSGDQSKKHQST